MRRLVPQDFYLLIALTFCFALFLYYFFFIFS